MKKSFLIASWLFSFGNSISSPLISLYIYVTSSITYTFHFLIINLAFLLFSYFLAGYLTNFRNDASLYYKLGIALYVAFYITLLLLNVNTYKFVSYVAALYGIAQGFYWFGWDILFYNIPKKLNFINRWAYLGYINTLLSPAIYGTILSLFQEKGYLFLFLITSVILFIAMMMMENANVSGTFNLKDSFAVIVRNKNYRFTTVSLSLVSGYNYIMSNLIPILLYRIVNKDYFYFAISNYLLGLLSLLSIYFGRSKLLVTGKMKPFSIVVLSVIALSLSSFSLFFYPLIFLVSYYIFSPLIYPIIDVYNWNNMERKSLSSYLINRQIFLNISRISSTILVSFFTISEGTVLLIPVLVAALVLFSRSKSGIKIE